MDDRSIKIFRAKNLEGVVVEYSPDLAQDLLQVHGLVASDIIENMYGTRFNISSVNNEEGRSFFIKTNDERDGVLFRWKEKM